ncbi:hypothetical protein MCAMS1_02354 [biofilm metagenome]
MKKNRRNLNQVFQEPKPNNPFISKSLLYLTLISLSIICLLIAHFNFNRFYWFFIVGLLGFSFTSACLIVEIWEYFLPPALVNHSVWTGEHVSGRGLAGLIAGILAIAIALGLTYLMKIMGVDYIV